MKLENKDGKIIVKMRGGRGEQVHKDKKKYTRKRKHKKKKED